MNEELWIAHGRGLKAQRWNLDFGMRCLESAVSSSPLFPAFRIMPLPINCISAPAVAFPIDPHQPPTPTQHRYRHRSHLSPSQFSNMEHVDDSEVELLWWTRCPICYHRYFRIWSVKVGGEPGTRLWWCFHCDRLFADDPIAPVSNQ